MLRKINVSECFCHLREKINNVYIIHGTMGDILRLQLCIIFLVEGGRACPASHNQTPVKTSWALTKYNTDCELSVTFRESTKYSPRNRTLPQALI